jgi:hypothetical protein
MLSPQFPIHLPPTFLRIFKYSAKKFFIATHKCVMLHSNGGGMKEELNKTEASLQSIK